MYYKLFVYDVVRGYSRLIDETVTYDDIPRLEKKYGKESIVIDGRDIIILKTRL